MLLILIASFVVVCAVIGMTLSAYVVLTERRRQDEDVILAAEPLRPEWIYARRMDVPKKNPVLRTRSAKVMGK